MKNFIISSLLLLLFVLSVNVQACNPPAAPAPAPCTFVGSWENDIAFNEFCQSEQVQTFYRSGFAEQEVFFPECPGLDSSLWHELRLYSFSSYSHDPAQNQINLELIIQLHRDVLGNWDTIYGTNSATIPIVYNLLGCDTLVFQAGVGFLDSLYRM